MGKYFSDTSDFSKYNLTDKNSDSNIAMPLTNNLTKPLSDQTKEKLAQIRNPSNVSNDDEYIDMVEKQTEQVTNIIRHYSEESKEEFTNHFKRFAPAELFEKINQVIYVVSQLANKITNLEKLINNGYVQQEKIQTPSITINDPSELYAYQENEKISNKINAPETIPDKIPIKNNNSTVTKMPTVEEVRAQLANIKNGKGAKQLPSEGYDNNGLNLEELFPHLDDLAYQTAYAALAQAKPKENIEEATPTPGKMRGIVF